MTHPLSRFAVAPESVLFLSLPEERALAAAAHADHGQRLAADCGQSHIPACHGRRRSGESVCYLLTKDIAHFSFSEGEDVTDLSF
jgi:hypothetical protein